MKRPIVVSVVFVLLMVIVSGAAHAVTHRALTAAGQGIVANMLENASADWRTGLGFNLCASLPAGRVWDVRADWGGRWLDGESRLITNPNHEPRWGGQFGETTKALRVMPFTMGIAYRFEDLSRGRFWVPYMETGPGFYDMKATFEDSQGLQRDHAMFRTGWHVRTGVLFLRTSGMHLSVETGLHFIDTPGKMSSMWEAGLGVGGVVPGPSR